MKHEKHYLKSRSSFIVVVLRSLSHKACVNCGKPIHTFEESVKHWEEALEKDGWIIGDPEKVNSKFQQLEMFE